ncbi:hypothetical protein LJC68_09940 [Bacteroidales bacterium OttesenSCG-928-B11]|nr:hypothetical protein [Bacteroidales bacterium OttesenSCG-928-E04]MDL2313180.1 hypothetical protein [Bacteroidales bacterium OttesenSCG-928-B11]MDL2326633.1 hypothetical protein [Bacteroidales bacterium OttesenSCG-928-A14]
MRKILLFIIASVLLPAVSVCQNDLGKMKLSGNVKRVKEISIETQDFGDDITCHLFAIFDENGNKTLDVNYNAMGQIVKNNQYQYDSLGNLVKSTHYNPDGSLYSYFTFAYKDNVLVEKNITYYKDGAPMRYCFRYDQKGNLLEEIDYDAYGKLFKGWQYSYNSRDQVTEERFYLPYGCLYDKVKFEYDFAGNLIKKLFYDMEGVLYREEHFTYDQHGYLVQESKIRYRGYKLNTETFSYQYQFDDKGNWINKMVNMNNIHSHTVVREIEYY